ncbi:MAG: BON domain-containing protein [Pseudomonadota bacterium]
MKSSAVALLLGLALCAGPGLADKSAGQVVDDAAVQARVKARLVDENFFGGLNINIEIRRGVVQLGGFVDDAASATKAANTARSVEGVVAVDNQLHVKEGKASIGQIVDDRVISTTVKGKLANAALGTGYKVNVDTYNGVVLLTGFVDSAATKAKAADLAKETSNVKQVINGIHVMN